MKLILLKNEILNLEKKILSSSPSCHIRVYKKGKKLADYKFGKTYKYYDLASLTKVIFTTLVCMKLHQEKKINLNAKVTKYLNWYNQDLSVINLLSHSSKLPAWYPFYKYQNKKIDHDFKLNSLKNIFNQIKPTQSYTYSDINFLLLGYILEEIEEKPLIYIWQDLYKFLKLKNIFFHINNKPCFSKKLYAPTNNSKIRKNITAIVNDDNAFSLNGISPHAGLFASMNGLSLWSLKIRDIYYGKNNFFYK